MKHADVVVNALMYAGVTLQTNEAMQTIQLILSIVTSAVIIAFKLWKWWKEASKDGKITADEIDEAVNILEDERKDK